MACAGCVITGSLRKLQLTHARDFGWCLPVIVLFQSGLGKVRQDGVIITALSSLESFQSDNGCGEMVVEQQEALRQACG